MLHSRAHEVWSLRLGRWLGVGNDPRNTPTTCLETFPLSWRPGKEAWRDPVGAGPAVLKARTLTNLYNQRPAWLTNLHAALDRAVWVAYGWEYDPAVTDDDAILARLLALNE